MIVPDKKVNVIINALKRHGLLGTKELQEELIASGVSIKQAQLYNILGKLQNNLFIYKKKGLYTLHPAWVTELCEFSSYVEKTQNIDIQSLKQGESKRILATSFVDVCVVRAYYASIVFQLSKAKEQRKYSQHHAYSLSMIRKEVPMPDFLHPKDNKQYELCAHNTFLDRYSLGFSRLPKAASICKELNLFDYQGYNINIIGDYMIQIHLGPFVKREMDEIYLRTKSLEEFDIEHLRSLLKMKEQCMLLVSYDPIQAKKRKEAIKHELDAQ